MGGQAVKNVLNKPSILIARNQIETISPVAYKDAVVKIPVGGHVECHIRQHNNILHHSKYRVH